MRSQVSGCKRRLLLSSRLVPALGSHPTHVRLAHLLPIRVPHAAAAADLRADRARDARRRHRREHRALQHHPGRRPQPAALRGSGEDRRPLGSQPRRRAGSRLGTDVRRLEGRCQEPGIGRRLPARRFHVRGIRRSGQRLRRQGDAGAVRRPQGQREARPHLSFRRRAVRRAPGRRLERRVLAARPRRGTGHRRQDDSPRRRAGTRSLV